ncbi:low specificity L-threonine aldolase [Emcibacter sp. SYSU 3D8]|uniref:threonine aldolase family protein n=1 Tax=Emcibacter sp. SYSU 3D8 TaxID=3133969 RepID=UPI0031FE4AB1
MPGCFLSDNAAGISPEILRAIADANDGAAAGYGADALTESLKDRFTALFEHDVDVFVVATGTAANALSLAACCPPWGAVLCHEYAHIARDECGAPEFYTAGAKLCLVPGKHGQVTLEGLEATYRGFRLNDQHQTQPGAVSLSQATESGTVYSVREVANIASWTHQRKMKLHMDGARFGNAVASLGCTPAEITWKAGVDILSFGATKNGALAAEAVIVFDPALAKDMAYRRKRAGQLLSKSRFFSAQLLAYLEGDLWLRNAARSNRTASALADGFDALGFELVHPVHANELFVRMPDEVAERLRGGGFQFLDWPTAGPGGRRLVTSSATTEDEVSALLEMAV